MNTKKILYYCGKGQPAQPQERKERLHSYLNLIPPRFKDKLTKIEDIDDILDKEIPSLKKDMKFYDADANLVEMVNIAMAVKRPLLLTGDAGCGKSELACSIAWELGLGEVLLWTIRSRSTVKEGLYHYDAIGRLQRIQEQEFIAKSTGNKIFSLDKMAIENFITLGPLGTALANNGVPRVLLIDEIDKSDIDFPNDLLHELDQFYFRIPELTMIEKQQEISLKTHDFQLKPILANKGKIAGGTPPIVIITSNEERELSKPFIRRCIQYKIKPFDDGRKIEILRKRYFDKDNSQKVKGNIQKEIENVNKILTESGISIEKRDVSISRLLDYFLCDYQKLSQNPELIKNFFQNE